MSKKYFDMNLTWISVLVQVCEGQNFAFSWRNHCKFMKIPRGYDSCVDAYRHSISDTNFKRSSKKIPRTLTSVLTQSSRSVSIQTLHFKFGGIGRSKLLNLCQMLNIYMRAQFFSINENYFPSYSYNYVRFYFLNVSMMVFRAERLNQNFKKNTICFF